jgi:hypothetical protein
LLQNYTSFMHIIILIKAHPQKCCSNIPQLSLLALQM